SQVERAKPRAAGALLLGLDVNLRRLEDLGGLVVLEEGDDAEALQLGVGDLAGERFPLLRLLVEVLLDLLLYLVEIDAGRLLGGPVLDDKTVGPAGHRADDVTIGGDAVGPLVLDRFFDEDQAQADLLTGIAHLVRLRDDVDL